MNCPYCESKNTIKNGKRTLKSIGEKIQYYRCHDCGGRFNERTGTPMAKLRTEPKIIEYAIHSRTEGMGLRATGRVYGKSHVTIMDWEKR
ncbi:MAG: IS1 family transposase [Synechococcaceae cyanobacterium RL_1_2]|nr:IS1 family transposase [Synechococcaceae cyanobacterium RL_1_2]